MNTNDLMLNLQPVTLSLTSSLERVNSPMLRLLCLSREALMDKGAEGMEATQADITAKINDRIAKLEYGHEQAAEVIFIFTRPQKAVRALLDMGLPAFRKAAMETIGDAFHPAEISSMHRACLQHYVESFAPALPEKAGRKKHG
jgi:hypothetical protein